MTKPDGLVQTDACLVGGAVYATCMMLTQLRTCGVAAPVYSYIPTISQVVNQNGFLLFVQATRKRMM